jgi:hypothetical protein
MKIFGFDMNNRIILGSILIIFGAIIVYSSTMGIDTHKGDVRDRVHVSPSPLYPFWLPLSYDLIQVADYTLQILTVGVFVTTSGIWIIIYDISRRVTIE